MPMTMTGECRAVREDAGDDEVKVEMEEGVVGGDGGGTVL